MRMHGIAPVFIPLLLGCSTSLQAAVQASSSTAHPAALTTALQSNANDVTQPHPNAAPSSESAPAAAPVSEAVQPAATNNTWHFSTIGYIFLAGAYGVSTPRSPLPSTDVNLSPRDALRVFKFALMGAAEARKGRLIFAGDLVWAHLKGSEGLSIRNRPEFRSVTLDTRSTTVTALGGYRVVETGPVIIDGLVGARLNIQDQALFYSGPLVQASASLKKTWVDPIAATRIFVPLGGKFSVSGYGDVGGFGIGSSFTWQAIGTANYQVNHRMRAGIGWRYFKVNYEDSDGFVYKVAQSGPLVTLRTDF